MDNISFETIIQQIQQKVDDYQQETSEQINQIKDKKEQLEKRLSRYNELKQNLADGSEGLTDDNVVLKYLEYKESLKKIIQEIRQVMKEEKRGLFKKTDEIKKAINEILEKYGEKQNQAEGGEK